MNQIKQKKSVYDNCRLILTAALFFAFIVFYTQTWGKYVYLALSVCLFALYAVHSGFKVAFRIQAFHLLTLAFVLFGYASKLWAIDPSKTSGPVSTLFRTLLCIYLVYWSFQDDEEITIIIDAMMWGSFAMTLYSFSYYGIGTIMLTITSGSRLLNDVINANGIGMFSALAIIIWFSKLLQRNFNLISTVMIAPSLLLVIASGSRKAILLVLLGIVITYMSNAREKNQNVIKRLLLIFVGILGLLFAFSILSRIAVLDSTFNRVSMMIEGLLGSGKTDASTETRMLMIKQGWETFKSYPIFGAGLGNGAITIGRDTYFHNNYIELLATGGVVGFLLYYLIYIYIAKRLWRYRNIEEANNVICIFILAMMVVMDFGQVSYTAKDTYFYLVAMFLQINVLKMKSNYWGIEEQ